MNDKKFHLSATIPIEIEEGIFLNDIKAREFGEKISNKYLFNEPFPHIVIDDFLPKELAEKILFNFPINNNVISEFKLNYPGIQENKRQVFPNDTNSFCRNIFGFFNSASFLQFLEGLTNIPSLLPDS